VQDKIAEKGHNAKKSVEWPTLKRFVTEKLGYPLEKHTYITEDGYINTVYRIPGKKFSKSKIGAGKFKQTAGKQGETKAEEEKAQEGEKRVAIY